MVAINSHIVENGFMWIHGARNKFGLELKLGVGCGVEHEPSIIWLI